MRTTPRRVLGRLLLSVALAAPSAEAQVCTGVDYFDRCLDAIGGRPADGSGARDPTRIVDDIFRTSDTPPRFAPQLTFGRLIPERSVINTPSCTGGVSSSVVDPALYPSANPRSYTAYVCVDGVTREGAALFGDRLDWRWLQNARVRSDGSNAVDVDDCGGDQARCGYTAPWRSGFVFDLQGAANRVVIFPVTDHVENSCLEAFEYSVYLTDDPASTGFVGDGEAPDPTRWNRAVLVRGFLRGWTNNPLSTGTVEDMTAHPLATGRDAVGEEAISDSITTVWSLPCGVEFRYAAVVPGNYGNPDARCAFHSNEDEFDAVAGLNEDNTAVCVDADRDGFRAAACGGPDCNDADPAVNPGAVESCASARDLNCDGSTPQCPTSTACVGGLCVPRCVESACSAGFTCVRPDGGAADYCVPAPCANVTCPAGQVCGARGCQDPCADATCPVGQVCRGGACVDPCAGLACPSRQHCTAGRCVPNCPCVPCAGATTCNATSGRCESPGCAALRCVPGTVPDCTGPSPRCVGSCVGVVCPLGARCDAATNRCVADRCAGVACPAGSACADGACTRLPPPD
ncbi:MAG: Tryptophan synthase alpha chain, partial [Myxococcaceae bacterium]|nr:Tryptophan synthase alpha chain [Myxococcaceae bacterium]